MFHKVVLLVLQRMKDVVGFFTMTLLQIYQRIFQLKKLKIGEDLTELWP